MKDFNKMSHEELLACFENAENAANEPDRLAAIVEMARRLKMMRYFTESLCKSAADRHAAEVGIVSAFVMVDAPSQILIEQIA